MLGAFGFLAKTGMTRAQGTVLTIAHRLNTIMDADQILVLGAGVIIEAGHPTHLLRESPSPLPIANAGGVF